jgi:hypothetical protein
MSTVWTVSLSDSAYDSVSEIGRVGRQRGEDIGWEIRGKEYKEGRSAKGR